MTQVLRQLQLYEELEGDFVEEDGMRVRRMSTNARKHTERKIQD